MIVNAKPGERASSSSDERQAPVASFGGADWIRAAFHQTSDLICAKDRDGRILAANKAMATSLGLAHPDELIDRTYHDLLPAELAHQLTEDEARVMRSGKPESGVERLIVHDDGKESWVEIARDPIYDLSNKVVGLVTISRDISSRKESERLMLAQAHLFDLVAQPGPLSKVLVNIATVIETHFPGAAASIRLLSVNGESFQEPVVTRLCGEFPELLEEHNAAVAMQIATSAIANAEPIFVSDIQGNALWRKDPSSTPAAFVRGFWSSPVFSNRNKALGVLSLHLPVVVAPTDSQMDLIAMASHMVSAAIERKEAEEQNNFLATHDTLTSLPNRMMFESSLAAALEAARSRPSVIGLAFFDLDNFKLVNDSLGHAAGDDLLKIVAERASGSIRRDGTIARLGGDEFVIFLTASPDQSDNLRRRFSEIRKIISAPISLKGRTLHVTCSMGAACFPDHAQTSQDLIACADAAMYRAKGLGRDNIQYFSKDMAESPTDQLILNSQLRDAVGNNELVLHYQPQVDLCSSRIVAGEALVRWLHPERDLLEPKEFIKTAEDTGLIIPIGDWVLSAACRQNKAWQDAGLAPIVVTVNVSSRQLREPDWVKRVEKTLDDVGLEGRFLELEVTESMIMQDMDMVVQKMRKLADRGVKFAIDDFGTGYSSLSVLKNLPVHRLKIDRSFVMDIPNNENDSALTSAIIVMAHKLKMRVVAEGVETKAQVEFLQAHYCSEAQGYFYSKPVPADKFESLIAKGLKGLSAVNPTRKEGAHSDGKPLPIC